MHPFSQKHKIIDSCYVYEEGPDLDPDPWIIFTETDPAIKQITGLGFTH